MTSASPPLTQAVTELRQTFSGELLSEGDDGYESARKVHNGHIDKRPILIARCRGVADIVDAVELARDHDLEVAIRGGGHNVAGRAVVDGGIMIDLSSMKGIHVDPEAAIVRAQPGVTWGELNRESQLRGLATTGGVVSTTGIAGLTLGGGWGWLAPKHGAAVDNLESVVLVTADGQVLTASEDENPDLFWAVRGAGTNFGVAATFEYRLHPVGPTITAGQAAHPFEKAGEVLRFYRQFMESTPDEMTAFGGMLYAPDGSGPPMAGIVVGHLGAPGDAEAAVRPVREFGSPLMVEIGPMSYCQLNEILDPYYPKGISYYWKAQFLAELSDEAIDAMVDCFARCPNTTSQLILEPFHGAVSRVPVHATAYPLRLEGFNLLILSQWTDPTETEPCIAWTRETYAAMEPYLGSSRYVNYLAEEEQTGDPVAAAYGPNYGKLRELKASLDPDNFFHMNANIPPEAS